MKNLVLVLFVFISNMVLSQLNTDSIAAIMIKLIRDDRNLKGSSFLYTSERCKKASKIHLDYTLKFYEGNTYNHNELKSYYCKKVLGGPSDRYALFNKDSITVQIGDDYYKKKPLWDYYGEIMTGCYVKDTNATNINEIIAKALFNNFKNSPSHYSCMMKTPSGGNIYRGNFSIGQNKEIVNGQEYFRFICVGLFDKSLYFNSEPNSYKKSKQSNFYSE